MRRKKVLIVDFDLEAPGVTTLNFCANACDQPGVVDYIHSYLDVGSAPNVQAYIHRCCFIHPDDKSEVELYVMPAGDQSASYGANFAKIDWRELYQERDGFLLMEDLREQWIAQDYDYVLIDSRTGLTDVSGICTRQLPDAVVAVFFPNEQNLVGLKDMVQSVRSSTARPRCPELLFVPSRLPRLDDEDGVLERWLERFKSELAYSEQQCSSLDQYDSLALLDQDIFVRSRPKTGLAKQYRQLSNLVAQLNSDDAEGSLNYIKSIARIYSGETNDKFTFQDASNPFSFERHKDRLQEIEDRHKNDCVIQRYLAEHYYSMRDFAHLEVVLKHGLSANIFTNLEGGVPSETIPRMHLLRMRMGAELGETVDTVEAALELLKCAGSTEFMVVEALMALVTIDRDALPPPQDIPFLQSVDLKGFVDLMRKFGISSREAAYNCKVALFARERFKEDISDPHKTSIVLALIAGGQFDDALKMLGDSNDPTSLASLDLGDAFNRVMALWGRDGVPEVAVFEAVLALALGGKNVYVETANYHQCLALINAVLGRVEACKLHIESARAALLAGSGRRETSCWSFVEEPEDDFLKHCDEIEKLSNGENIIPLFISRNASIAGKPN
jgi:MinD-like ATPase involved in chromosome partitioning or flagellar assembly